MYSQLPESRGHWRLTAIRTDGDVALLLGSGENETGLSVLKGVDLKVKGGGGVGQTQTHHKSSPPHSRSLAWLSVTAVGGIASAVQSGQAAGRSPDTPEEVGRDTTGQSEA